MSRSTQLAHREDSEVGNKTSRSGETPVGAYVGGVWTPGDGETFSVVNPATEETIADISGVTVQQTGAAIGAAAAAFSDGPWSRTTPRERGRLLGRLADLLDRDSKELADLMIEEIGTPITLASAMQVPYAVDNFRWFADAAVGLERGYEAGVPKVSTFPGQASEILREPVGVVAALTAFNFPLNLAAWKLGGALASGCSVVLMSSPRAVMTTAALVRLIEEAGFPAGAVNFVFGSPAVAESLCSDPRVDMVSFTGSAEVGSRIAALCAPTLKRVVLELGGKSPDVILPGTDVEGLALASVLGWALDSGQTCSALTRTLVPRIDYDRYLEAAAAAVASLGVGDPKLPSTVVGPLISDSQRSRVSGYVERAVASGAEVVCGGRTPPDHPRGYYYEPTVVTRVTNESDIAQDELFGPVSVVLPYDEVESAIAMANDSRYGLAANVWGRTSDALDVARRLRAGTVSVNGGGGGMRCDHPWGGYKQSGLGREGGVLGLQEFFEVKNVLWPLNEPEAAQRPN